MTDSIPQQAGPGAGALIEAVAQAIYNQWQHEGDWVPWVERGNSNNQDAARSLARKALSHLAAPIAVEDSRERCASSDAEDADRYRWLCGKFGVTKLPCAIERIIEGTYVADGKDSIDAAIDAAMAAASSGAQPEQQQGQGLVHPAMSTSGRTSVDAAPNAPSAEGSE